MADKKKSIKTLEQEIYRHKLLYYQGNPEITDHEYDALEEKLKKVDPENKFLQMVGLDALDSAKVRHERKMLSLDKTYVIEDLLDWIDHHKVTSVFKIDGISCSLIYEHGQLVMAKTRGDGTYGENITKKILWISDVPKEIPPQDYLEIRGEVYCPEEQFYKLSDEMEKKGLERPTSQRNIVAGLMGRKDHIELCRYLGFKAFDYENNALDLSEEIEKYQELEKMGFDVPEARLHPGRDAQEAIMAAIKEANDFSVSGDYQIDGLVFSYNDLKEHGLLGETSHHPRYKIAFKFKGESKTAKLEEILWQVSRNGILTPIGRVEPIELSGAIIERVSLHNYGLVKNFNLKRGDLIEMIRSGEVIPKFLQVVKASDEPFNVPTECPSCATSVVINDIRLLCPNPECPALIKEGILNFIKKIGIDDLSSKRLEEMIRKGLVKKVPDLYKLEIEDFLTLEKVKDKLAQKLYQNIQKTKKINLVTFLSALGIAGGAYTKCERVVQAGFNTLDKILALTEEKLMEINSFAEKSSADFINSLNEKKPMIKALLNEGMQVESAEVILTGDNAQVSGMKFCITGALAEKRSVIESKIKKAGGLIVGSVSKNTNYLVTNETDSASSKFRAAKELQIPILSEQELLQML